MEYVLKIGVVIAGRAEQIATELSVNAIKFG
jgi:hypothetical protein